ncbi:MAG: PucR family transcriptional regulator, partial [Ornithinimicrobium sp.]
VLRRRVAGRRRVREAAAKADVTVVALAEQASWAHVVWLLRGAIDRSATHDERAGDPPVHDDLFGLADAVATLVSAPVTIEDARSRVLAYSARQDVADEARVSTIIGRRVPEALLASYRSGGVFRRLANSSDPFLLPASVDGHVRARYVVPVRAGQEWLGSIWAVTDTVPPPRIVGELASTASVVALHLLRLRSRTDLSQQVVAERLRQALTGVSSDAHRWLPPGPWRVVALGSW